MGDCFVCGKVFVGDGRFCCGYCKRLVAIAIETKINGMDDDTLLSLFSSMGLVKSQLPSQVR